MVKIIKYNDSNFSGALEKIIKQSEEIRKTEKNKNILVFLTISRFPRCD